MTRFCLNNRPFNTFQPQKQAYLKPVLSSLSVPASLPPVNPKKPRPRQTEEPVPKLTSIFC